MLKKILVIGLLLTMVLFAACQAETVAVERMVDDMAMGGESAPAAEPMPESPSEFDTGGSATNSVGQAQGTDGNVQVPQQPMIIRTGNMNIVVADVDEAVANISDLALAMGGWIVNTGVRQSGQFRHGEVTVRVPVTDFDVAMQEIRDMSVEVTSESVSGQDVTAEYVDLSARLGNLEATAARVRAFLDETRNVEEALAVNAELSRLEAEIESLKGRLQYLSQSAAFSTINISLTPDEASQPIEIGGWQPTGVAKDAVELLVSALQDVADFLIVLVIYILPMFLIIGVPLYLIGRFILRRIRRRDNRVVEAPEATEAS
jgi:hypothetical protein